MPKVSSSVPKHIQGPWLQLCTPAGTCSIKKYYLHFRTSATKPVWTLFRHCSQSLPHSQSVAYHDPSHRGRTPWCPGGFGTWISYLWSFGARANLLLLPLEHMSPATARAIASEVNVLPGNIEGTGESRCPAKCQSRNMGTSGKNLAVPCMRIKRCAEVQP